MGDSATIGQEVVVGQEHGEKWLESGDLLKADLPGGPEGLEVGYERKNGVQDDPDVSGLGSGRMGLPSAETVKTRKERSGACLWTHHW